MTPRGVVAEVPAPGQESVWDYPRPPVLDPVDELVIVTLAETVVVETRGAVRVLETSHPPAYYLPRDDFTAGTLRLTTGSSICEYKGRATYYDIVVADIVVPSAAWSYETPSPAFASITGYISLYPAAMQSVTVDGEVVRPQEGGFYGGWITDRVVGPFKGAPGSRGW